MKDGYDRLAGFDVHRVGPEQEDIGFGDVYRAYVGMTYGPVTHALKERSLFGFKPEDGFSARDYLLENMTEEEQLYPAYFLRATSKDHMEHLRGSFAQMQKSREDFGRASFGQQILAGFTDPINGIAIPFGAGATTFAAMGRAGLAVGGVTMAQEAVRYPFDPMATPEEPLFAVGTSAIFGGTLGGLASIPAARRARAIQEGTNELNRLSKAIDPDNPEFDAEIADNIFTDTWLYKAVSTPMKRTLQESTLPNSVKLDALKLANDNGLLLAGNRQGKALDPSVYILAKLREGEMVQVYDDLLGIHAEASGLGRRDVLDYNPKRQDFEEWTEAVDRKAITGEKAADAYEEKAISRLNEFYNTWEKRLREEGLIGDTAYFKRSIEYKTKKINDIDAEIQTMKSDAARFRAERFADRLREEVDVLKAQMDEAAAAPSDPQREAFRPRFWDRDAIRANREALEKILADWYKENPYTYDRNLKTGKWERTELSTDDASVRGRAAKTVDTILGLDDQDLGIYSGGGSKHFRHRALDIPNSKVLDFIETNPIAIMKAYTTKVAPRYEFSVKFGGRSVDDVTDEMFIKAVEGGASVEVANRAAADFRGLHGVITKTMLRNPDHWSHSTARYMRTGATLSYLGGAGLATITEPAKIMMEHGIGNTMRGLFAVLKDNQLKMGAKEGRIAGEALETLLGSVIMRIGEDMTNNPLRGDLLDRAQNAFFLLNGLGPITHILKDFDAMMRVHTLIDYSVRATKGQASDMELDYLARYGIDLDLAKEIANAPWQKSSSGMYMANTEAWTNTIEFPATKADIVTGPTNSYAGERYKPSFYRASENRVYIDEDYIREVMWHERGWENPRVEGVKPIEAGIINSPDDLVTFIKMHEIMHSLHSAKSLGITDKRTKAGKAAYENAINDLAVAEIKKQARVKPETVTRFRAALSSGIMNTILMGTPADKPLITNGVALIPMRVAKKFGMKEDPKYKGFARVENGLLGLPFQFYSYTLAALNKITVAHAHGQMKNQLLGTAIAMGLGYMLLQIRTPNYVDMSFQDQFSRAFDYSGTASIYSDLMYTAMSTSLALGGPNLTGGLLQPRYPVQPSAAEAATGIMGAGPSYTYDLGKSVYDLLTGNVSEGSKDLIRNLPLARLWFLKGMTNRMTNALADTLEQTDGYGRF